MGLQQSLKFILENWSIETKNTFAQNHLANYIRSDFVNEVRAAVGIEDNLQISASAGAGTWANIPWLSILDERITETTQDGVYPVYLFRADASGVYLSLNQGITLPRNQFGAHAAQEIAEKRKNLIRSLFPELEGWEHGPLDLRADTSLGRSYQQPNIASKFYSLNDIPSEERLRKDLQLLLKVYGQISQRWQKINIGSVENDMSTEPFQFNSSLFFDSVKHVNLKFDEKFQFRVISSLISKPFVILTGLTGSGKTKLAEAFSQWISEDSSQYKLVAVGADWINREPLLGYPNALEPDKYVKPDNGVLDLLVEADKPENRNKPYFLILDEMNMSHVERYFADFLSAMESSDKEISLHADTGNPRSGIPASITLPDNLFIIGTVNVDETTYMFSPKVLDRANVIEFRAESYEMESFLEDPKPVYMEDLRAKGASMGADFVQIAGIKDYKPIDGLKDELILFFNELKKVGAEFGYRAANEISRFTGVVDSLTENELSPEEILDAAVLQKLLPKVHGSRNKIEKVLVQLGKLSLKVNDKDPFTEGILPDDIKYPLTYEKLERMHDRVISDGFTSFAEA